MTDNMDAFDSMWQVGRIPDVQPFQIERRADLVAGGLRQVSDNTFVIFRDATPDGQVRIVKNIAPFLQRRINMTTPQETVEYVSPEEADGFFAFNPLVSDRSAVASNIDFNAPAISSAALDTDRTVSGGTSFLSARPKVDAQRWNPLYNFPVEAKQELSVNFTVLALADTSPLPGAPVIGDAAGLVLNRIDFAGVVIFGVQMPVTTYNQIIQQSRIQ